MGQKENYLSVLERWQKHQFRQEDIPLATAADAIAIGDTARIYALSTDSTHWMMYDRSTSQPAVFSFAVVWSFNRNLDTGTYVPKGEERPTHVPDWAATDDITNPKCNITYGFDVSMDASIFAHIKAFEDYIVQIPGFNIAKKQRSSWQNGTSTNGKYSISHRLFIPCTPSQYRKPSAEQIAGIHPWLTSAADSTKNYMLNSPFPSYLDYSDGKTLSELKDVDPPYFSKGDIVVFTFRLGFYIGEHDWRPEIMPEEFIRVEKDEALQKASRIFVSQWPTGDIRRRLVPGKIGPLRADHQVDVGMQEVDPGSHDSQNSDKPPPSTPSEGDDVMPFDNDGNSSDHSVESLKRRAGEEEAMEIEDEAVFIPSGGYSQQGDEDMDPVLLTAKKGKKKRNYAK